MRYHHVDVFSSVAYSGNSLAVFPDAAGLTGLQMGRVAKELRHFESIFLIRDGEGWQARVFDVHEEVRFAGHPVVGAACVLHALAAGHGDGDGDGDGDWTIHLPDRTVQVSTCRIDTGRFHGVLDPGPVAFTDTATPRIAHRFGLTEDDLDQGLPAQVVFAGLRYLVLPVRGGALARARITADVTADLATLGAEYAYLLDAAAMEGRHWNNDGLVEDVATGSAAACVAAYLHRHGRLADGQAATLHQGRFTGRPSEMTISVAVGEGGTVGVRVGGDVALVGEGRLDVLP
ncbi:PhzF family phenazine biosynthesis protein [Catellatospora citrea]|uniref:PhzF family phenazine biosynthesis protein n=1 Tax=Catellatospora citrea TaxID=53366 RepID=UPI000E72BD7A|nr:PhzF family phenazine biosynthesis protein [Catellatospora citrea]